MCHESQYTKSFIKYFDSIPYQDLQAWNWEYGMILPVPSEATKLTTSQNIEAESTKASSTWIHVGSGPLQHIYLGSLQHVNTPDTDMGHAIDHAIDNNLSGSFVQLGYEDVTKKLI